MTHHKSVVVVSGATGGMGQVISGTLAGNGATVVMLGRDLQRLDTARREIIGRAERAGTLDTVAADVNDAASVDAAIAGILTVHGRIDALVHTAGDSPVRSILTATDDEWQASLNSKLLGAVRLMRAVGRSMTERGTGSIVLIGGVFRVEPSPLFPIASALNAAVGALAKAVSKDFGSYGVRVNVVDPGATDTGRWGRYCDEIAAAAGGRAADINRGIVDAIPLRRLASPQDVADLVAFLISGKAAYLNGGAFVVDGGATASL